MPPYESPQKRKVDSFRFTYLGLDTGWKRDGDEFCFGLSTALLHLSHLSFSLRISNTPVFFHFSLYYPPIQFTVSLYLNVCHFATC